MNGAMVVASMAAAFKHASLVKHTIIYYVCRRVQSCSITYYVDTLVACIAYSMVAIYIDFVSPCCGFKVNFRTVGCVCVYYQCAEGNRVTPHAQHVATMCIGVHKLTNTHVIHV